MYPSIGSIIYVFGAILSVITLFSTKSSIPSFFSRGRFLQLLRNENQDLDDILKKLRKLYFSDYSYFTVFPIVAIFSILSILGIIRLTLDVSIMVLDIIFVSFTGFVRIDDLKLTSLYMKNVDEVTDSLRKIVDKNKIVETVVVSTITMFIFLSAEHFVSNPIIYGGLLRIAVLSALGTIFLVLIVLQITIRIRSVERDYLFKLKNEGKLPPFSVKISLKRQNILILGNLESFDLSRLIIQETDGYRLSLEYNKVETISSMTKKYE